jgi:hypothetical protein
MKKNYITVITYFLSIFVISASEILIKENGTRTWLGESLWANTMPDCRWLEGWMEIAFGKGRHVQLLTAQIEKNGDFQLDTAFKFNSAKIVNESHFFTGVLLGIQGENNDFRKALINIKSSLKIGLDYSGNIHYIVNQQDDTSYEIIKKEGVYHPNLKVMISIQNETKESFFKVNFTQEKFKIEAKFPKNSTDLSGSVGLFCEAPRMSPTHEDSIKWQSVLFESLKLKGQGVKVYPERGFGPILWTQYTYGKNNLRMIAQMAPVSNMDNQDVILQFKDNEEWKEVQKVKIDSLSLTALFELENLKLTKEQPYRVVYEFQGQLKKWDGIIRNEPTGPQTKVAVYSCDNGYLFPNETIVNHTLEQNPDLVFFAGDQIYENYGGFGCNTKGSLEHQMLEYLRKYWLFGWSWRDVLKDRPSVILPDDHDVFQGNLWGHGGRALPVHLIKKPDDEGFALGGYKMPVPWVNAVQRTQAGNLPLTLSSGKSESGIEHYFTQYQYGKLDLLILEDRKFKSGPALVKKDADASLDLFGSEQELLMKNWSQQSAVAGGYKVILSQTLWAQAHTHAGQQLKVAKADTDTGGWPVEARNRALEAVASSNPVMLHGDQHLGVLARLPNEKNTAAPYAFMVPGTANGFPRAWWPDAAIDIFPEAKNGITGHFKDRWGHPIEIIAVANPDRDSIKRVKENKSTMTSTEIAHCKGSGYGTVIFHHDSREVEFWMWQIQAQGGCKPFTGFPVKAKID